MPVEPGFLAERLDELIRLAGRIAWDAAPWATSDRLYNQPREWATFTRTFPPTFVLRLVERDRELLLRHGRTEEGNCRICVLEGPAPWPCVEVMTAVRFWMLPEEYE